MDDGQRRGGLVSAAITFALFAVPLGLVCLGSAYSEALEAQFVCEAGNCVPDGRNWFERHPGLFALTLCTAAACLGLVIALVISRRLPARV